MKMTNLLLAAAVAVSGLTAATAANAAVTVNFNQVGGNVVVTATGTFNTNLSPNVGGSGSVGQFVSAGPQFFGLGTQGAVIYYGSTGPSYLSGSAFTNFDTTSGTTMFFNGAAGVYGLSSSYVSNSAILATGTILNKTLAGIGAVTGSYVQTVGGNTLTINVGQAVAAVPEPATWGLMILGFGMIGAASRSRKVKTTVAYA
ncbi:PEPxxWA-CTERM sorting domain-containing protein [Sphingomonas sp. GB1N7]|uniref:PEPxxWA-CTERM sorting domain-containing protein n=1 Tax=Parasphingomonas caseinilytica TaxID=3096158 RepID=UPI002FCAD2AF